MKTLITIILACGGSMVFGQSIVGKWQLSEQKTCFEANMKESETEKELTPSMGGSSATGAARIMTLDEKGGGENGVVSEGKKKASSKESFKYQLSGSELQMLDKKSGIIMSRWIIDELTDTSLRLHDAVKDCETKSYIRIK